MFLQVKLNGFQVINEAGNSTPLALSNAHFLINFKTEWQFIYDLRSYSCTGQRNFALVYITMVVLWVSVYNSSVRNYGFAKCIKNRKRVQTGGLKVRKRISLLRALVLLLLLLLLLLLRHGAYGP